MNNSAVEFRVNDISQMLVSVTEQVSGLKRSVFTQLAADEWISPMGTSRMMSGVLS